MDVTALKITVNIIKNIYMHLLKKVQKAVYIRKIIIKWFPALKGSHLKAAEEIPTNGHWRKILG